MCFFGDLEADIAYGQITRLAKHSAFVLQVSPQKHADIHPYVPVRCDLSVLVCVSFFSLPGFPVLQ